ncbi:MAG TPA: sigma-70 family RNA polymerase sigma factor [Polyangiaceae bacterium]|nr:sigma-70 family RNA polymerase sigma factor [Polyangiaceae bacterium]
MNQAMHSFNYKKNSTSKQIRLSAQALDDGGLTEAALSGDEQAWAELLRRHGPTMRRCITSVTSRFRAVASPEDEHDIFATVCLRLVQHQGKRLRAFDPTRGCSLGAWLGTITIRTTYDFLRKHKRDSKRSSEALLDSMTSSEPDAFDCYLGAQRAQLLQDWMQQMNQRDRVFLENVCTDTTDPKKLADEMGISVATVYSKKHKLIARLNRQACATSAGAAA